MSELAVKGCTVEISSTAGNIDASSIEITSDASTDVLVGDNGVYFDKISVLISGVTLKTTVPSTTNEGIIVSESLEIEGTASNILNGSDEVALQKNDSVTKTLTFTFTTTSSPPSTTTADFPVTLKITDAGQSDIIAS